MIKYLRQRNPFHYPLLFFYTIAINVSLFYYSASENTMQKSVFASVFQLNSFTFSKPTFIILSIIILFLASLIFNLIFAKLHVFEEINILPAFTFITLKAMLPEVNVLSFTFLSLIIMLLVVYNLLKLFEMEHATEHIFFTSFFLGLSGLFFFPVIYYLLFVIIAFPILKRPTFQELFLILIGAAIPFFLLAFYFYFTGKLYLFFDVLISFFKEFHYPDFSIYSFYILPVIILFLILSFGYFQDKFLYSSKTVRESRFTNTFTLYFFISLLIFLFLSDYPFLFAVFFIIPVSYYIGIILIKGQTKISNIIITIIILTGLTQQIIFILK